MCPTEVDERNRLVAGACRGKGLVDAVPIGNPLDPPCYLREPYRWRPRGFGSAWPISRHVGVHDDAVGRERGERLVGDVSCAILQPNGRCPRPPLGRTGDPGQPSRGRGEVKLRGHRAGGCGERCEQNAHVGTDYVCARRGGPGGSDWLLGSDAGRSYAVAAGSSPGPAMLKCPPTNDATGLHPGPGPWRAS